MPDICWIFISPSHEEILLSKFQCGLYIMYENEYLPSFTQEDENITFSTVLNRCTLMNHSPINGGTHQLCKECILSWLLWVTFKLIKAILQLEGQCVIVPFDHLQNLSVHEDTVKHHLYGSHLNGILTYPDTYIGSNSHL